MRASISLVLVVWAGAAHAAVAHVPIKSSLVLKPGQIYTVAVEATQPAEIGWQAVQPKECTINCVQIEIDRYLRAKSPALRSARNQRLQIVSRTRAGTARSRLTHEADGAEQAVHLIVGAGGKVQRVPVARHAVPDGDRP